MAEKKFYKINQGIRATNLRVINEKGKQIGILSLAEALRIAQEKGLDLVEIAPTANPPVAKIIDFKKFLYLEEKRKKKVKKAIKKGRVKEIRLEPFIAQADFDFRTKRAKEFLEEGNKVKLVVKFSRREFEKKQFGYNILGKFREALAEISQPEEEPKFIGKNLVLTLSPKKEGKNDKKEIKS